MVGNLPSYTDTLLYIHTYIYVIVKALLSGVYRKRYVTTYNMSLKAAYESNKLANRI